MSGYNPNSLFNNTELDRQIFEAAKEGKEAVLFTEDVMNDQKNKTSFEVRQQHTFYQLNNAEDYRYAKNTFEEVTGMTPNTIWVPAFTHRIAKNETFTGFIDKIKEIYET